MIEVQLDIHASLAIHDREAGGLPQALRGNGQYRAVALTDNWPGQALDASLHRQVAALC